MQLYNWDIELPYEARQRRELFALAGSALYHAQCIEMDIVTLLAINEPNFITSSPDARQKSFDTYDEQTLGRLIKNLKNRCLLSAELETELDSVLTYRNSIAHKYFKEMHEKILVVEERAHIINELLYINDVFSSLSKRLEKIVMAKLYDFGLSKDDVDKEYSKIIAIINNIDTSKK